MPDKQQFQAEDETQLSSKPRKKVKTEQKTEESQKWIVVSQAKSLTVQVSDHSKTNRYHSHTSIQKYLRYLSFKSRYLLTKGCPNPMWLAVKRQSQVEQIVYIDLQIENALFEFMLTNQTQLPFLSAHTNSSNKAVFRESTFLKEGLWQELFLAQTQAEEKKIELSDQILGPMSQVIYNKFNQKTLTNAQLGQNLYPSKQLPLYREFYDTSSHQCNYIKPQNKIMAVDCEMVSTINGLELARATFCDYNGKILFDQYFKPVGSVTDYHTAFSGITQQILDRVTNTIDKILFPFILQNLDANTILIGQSLENDLVAMKLIHRKVIDTAVLYMRKNGCKMKLKSLASQYLGRKIQSGNHDSLEDCRAALDLAKKKVLCIQSHQIKYILLQELVSAKKMAVIVDYDIENLRNYNSMHFQKVQKLSPAYVNLSILRKYMNPDVCRPCLLATRIQRPNMGEWQNYYKNFDDHFRQLYQKCMGPTLFFLNCQVNPFQKIVLKKYDPTNRPFCILLAKS